MQEDPHPNTVPTGHADIDPLAAELLGEAPASRRLRAGAMLTAAMRAFTKHPVFYLVVGMLCYLPGASIELAYTLAGRVSTNPLGFWPTRLADTLFSSIGFALMLHLTLDSLAQHEASFARYAKLGLADAFSVFVVQFLVGLGLLVSAIPGAIMLAIGTTGGGMALLVGLLGLVVLLATLMYVYLGFSLALPIYIDSTSGHRITPSQSLGRSWSLMKRRRWPLFQAILALDLALIVVGCVGLIPLLVGSALGAEDAASGVDVVPVLGSVLTSVLVVVCQTGWAVGSVLITSVAFTQLGRRQGVDVESMVEVFS